MRPLALALALAIACGGGHRSATQSSLIPRRAIDLAGRALHPEESRVLDKHGFVILGQGEAPSFHVGYTALFHKHQPVYITADSLLYAWHASYDAILMELELEHLVPTMNAMLGELRGRLSDAKADAQTRADVDAYLAIALSLATGTKAAPIAGGDPALIAAMYEQGREAQGDGLKLFGAQRDFDFSMLKPRGHYTSRPELEHYFRAMSWLGRVEIRIARKLPGQPWQVDRRALRAANLLASLFTADTRKQWEAIDSTLAAFVGPPDSMSLPGLASALTALRHDLDAPDADVVAAFGAPSAQRIRTQLALAGEESLSFVTLGQRFVFDAKVLSDLTHGSLNTEPPRVMPTPLDIAHTVFHNPAARPLLDPDVARYGAAYAKALDTVSREATAEPALWSGSLYHGWLGALRELSPDAARDSSLPAPLASDAWSRRMLGTQLASWAELRHDNLLYAKQSFTGVILCAYPDGYVEPYPAFYGAMEVLAHKGRATVDALAFRSRGATKLVAFFDHMARTMARLRTIAERQRANEPLLAEDLDFFNHMVSLTGDRGGCGVTTEPQGWYADLFYDRGKILHHEPVIADVHTQPTDEHGAPVGRVLHVGTGVPRMLVARLQHDRGANAQTYRGFVSTYAETITNDFKRLTDEEWREQVGTIDSTPAWLKPLIAP